MSESQSRRTVTPCESGTNRMAVEFSSTSRPSGERELRRHSSIVNCLATVPTADGVLPACGDTQGRPVGRSPAPSDRPSVAQRGRYRPADGPVLDEFALAERASAPSTRREATICPGVVPAMARNSRLRCDWS